MSRYYAGDFGSWEDVQKDYGISERQPKFVFAYYEYEDYTGSSLVITSEDGENFRIHDADHCSCHGLEECWSPTEGHPAEAVERIMNARLARTRYAAPFGQWLREARAEPSPGLAY